MRTQRSLVASLVLLFFPSLVHSAGHGCEGPPIFDNAYIADRFVDLTEWPDGTTVYYHCDSGYIRQGWRDMTCQDGTWSEKRFICEEIRCPWRRPPDNGFIVTFGNRAGETMQYNCNPGYVVIGSRELHCHIDGEWRPRNPPQCRLKLCPETSPLEHGIRYQNTFSMIRNQFGMVEEYSCDTGYRLEGPHYRECTAEGEWSGTEPACEEIVCDPPEPLYNGELVALSGYRVYATVYFRCNREFDVYPPGSKWATCNGDLTWDTPTPQCLKRAVPPTLQDGQRTYRSDYRERIVKTRTRALPYDTAVTSSCFHGFELISAGMQYLDSDRYVSVNMNGTWVPPMPSCTAARCEVRPSDTTIIRDESENDVHGKIEHNAKVYFTCSFGHEFPEEGDNTITRTCLNGQLNQPSDCQPKNCEIPDIKHGGLVNINGSILTFARHRDKVAVRCEEGYERMREEIYTPDYESTCIFGNFNNTPFALCVEARCDIHTPSNMIARDQAGHVLHQKKINHNTEVTFACRNGSSYPDSNEMNITKTCSRGHLDHPRDCIPNSCGVLSIEGGQILTYDGGTAPDLIHHDEKVRIVCDASHELKLKNTNISSFEATCRFGVWSDEFPECVGKRCFLNATDYPNYEPFRKSVLDDGERITVSCKTRYQFERRESMNKKSKSFKCVKGDFRTERCIPDRCTTDAMKVQDGALYRAYGAEDKFIYSKAKHGVKLNIKCEDGFTLTLGGRNINLLTTECRFGRWNVTELPRCIREEAATQNNPIITTRSSENQSSQQRTIRLREQTTEHVTTTKTVETSSAQTTLQPTQALDRKQLEEVPRTGFCEVPDGRQFYRSSLENHLDERFIGNGERITSYCDEDGVYIERNLTCVDGMFKGEWACPEIDAPCSLLHGHVTQRGYTTEAVCDEGYTLNSHPSVVSCENGILRSVSNTDVLCEPKNCTVPTYRNNMRISRHQSELAGNFRIRHLDWVNISCTEPGTEPAKRLFQCVAGRWKLDDDTYWDTVNENDTTRFPKCRPALCKRRCENGGLCVRDNQCRCSPGTQGLYCERVGCALEDLPATIQLNGTDGDKIPWRSVADDSLIVFTCKEGHSFETNEERISRRCINGMLPIPSCAAIRKCPNECMNGGTCVNGSCVCPAFAIGESCQIVTCRPPPRKYHRPSKHTYHPGDKVESICRRNQTYWEVSVLECHKNGSWTGLGDCREECFNTSQNIYPIWDRMEERYCRGVKSISSCFTECLKDTRFKAIYWNESKKTCFLLPHEPTNEKSFQNVTKYQSKYVGFLCANFERP